MSVLRRVRTNSQQLLTVAEIRAVESGVSADFDAVLRSFITGTTTPYIVRGFSVNVDSNSFTLNASNLTIDLSDALVLLSTSDQSGTILPVTSTAIDSLSSTLNTKVSGSFVAGTTNYVSIRYLRKQDSSTVAPLKFWDAEEETNIVKNVPTATILDYQLVISTSTPPSTQSLIATIVTDTNNVPTQIQDNRNLIFRLGTGGTSPSPLHNFSWPEGRLESSYVSSNALSDPFFGGDKGILTMKDWFDAVMSSIKEIKGTTYWYQTGGSGGGSTAISLFTLAEDTALSYVTSEGNMIHSASTTGAFYWDQPLFIRSVISEQYYKVSSITETQLAMTDGQVQFVSLTRYQDISGNVSFSPSTVGMPVNVLTLAGSDGARIVAGTSPQFGSLVAGVNGDEGDGDFIKVAYDSNKYFRQVQEFYDNSGNTSSAANAAYLVLSSAYEGSTGSQPTTYSQTLYSGSEIQKGDKDQVLNGGGVGQIYWLAFRRDDKVYTKFFGEMKVGESRGVSNETSNNLLSYIGAPNEATNDPVYSATVSGGFITGTTNYGSTTTDSLTERASRLTTAAANQAQNKNIQLVGGGELSNAAGLITWTDTAYVIIGGPTGSIVNQIDAGNANLTANTAAYVTIDRNSNATLPVSVTGFQFVPLTENTYVIARRLTGNDVWAGIDGGSLYIADNSSNLSGFNPSAATSLGIGNLHKWRQFSTTLNVSFPPLSGFFLPDVPYSQASLLVFRNGIFQDQSVDYNLAITSFGGQDAYVLFTDAAIDPADEFVGMYATGNSIPYSYVQSVTNIAVTTPITSLGVAPSYTKGVAVFLNGLLRNTNDYIASNASLSFSFDLVPGDKISTFYTSVNDNVASDQMFFNEAASNSRIIYSLNKDNYSPNSMIATVDGVANFFCNNDIGNSSVTINDYQLVEPRMTYWNPDSITTGSVLYVWSR